MSPRRPSVAWDRGLLKGPNDSLSDYVPFYFTPFSAMMYNILSGRNVHQRESDEIVILVSSIRHIERLGLPYVFTDSHAYYQWANYYSDPRDLPRLDWDLLQRRDFTRDLDRKSVASGKSVSVRVDLDGRRIIKTHNQ